MKTINVDFTDSTVGNLGRAGEHKNTKIIFALSPELAKCDFLTAEIGTATGEKIPVEGTYNEENSTFSIILTNQLTVEGVLSLQLVGYVTEAETAEPQIITKSPIVSGFITQSINGVEASADSNPNLLARIWAKIREWADKIHTHDNYWSLSDLYCEASEVEQGGNNPFPILPDYVGVDRPTFRGNYLRYNSDGAVINEVEKKEENGSKFFRMYFNKGILDTLFNVPPFVDIPVKEINEKTEIGLNGTGLELDLGVGSGGVLTPEQSADLEANTAARHEHENKDLLDTIGRDDNGRLFIDGDGILTESDAGDFVSSDDFSKTVDEIKGSSVNIDEYNSKVSTLESDIQTNRKIADAALKFRNSKGSHDTVTISISSGTHYVWGEVGTLTIELNETTDRDLARYRQEYTFTFISGATPTVLTLPSSVKWANELTIEANKRYEISIVDNIGLWCAVEVTE